MSIISACLVPARGVGVFVGSASGCSEAGAACAGSGAACGAVPAAATSWCAGEVSCASVGRLCAGDLDERRLPEVLDLVPVLQLGPEVLRADPAVEQAGCGRQDLVGGEAVAPGALRQRLERLALVGRVARPLVEGREDGRDLGLGEVGHG
jgi:hypothetical protein